MYEGLYDTRRGLSETDSQKVGLMTAQLLLPWTQWVHRRVERITFCDEDALNRNVSVDFTLPLWFHELRRCGPHTEADGKLRQLVPLGFLSKGPLVNFSLRDETDRSLPLLTRPQNTQVAEAVLLVMARAVLGKPVPTEIGADITALVRDDSEKAQSTYKNLFRLDGKAWAARKKLANFAPFAIHADLFRRHFLALSMLDIGRHERRVVHFAYEEGLEESLSKGEQLVRLGTQVLGGPRRVPIGVASVSEASSYHVEVEAPAGLMISKRVSDYFSAHGVGIKTERREGTFRRAHFHFSEVMPRSGASVTVYLHPRKSSVVRAATLMALVAFTATVAVALRFPHIVEETNDAAAALLLAAAGIIGLVVVRGGEDEMATTLLFPLRFLATVPVVLAVLAAVVVVIQPQPLVAYLVLGMISLLMATSAALLAWNWHVIRRAGRKAR